MTVGLKSQKSLFVKNFKSGTQSASQSMAKVRYRKKRYRAGRATKKTKEIKKRLENLKFACRCWFKGNAASTR